MKNLKIKITLLKVPKMMWKKQRLISFRIIRSTRFSLIRNLFFVSGEWDEINKNILFNNCK